MESVNNTVNTDDTANQKSTMILNLVNGDFIAPNNPLYMSLPDLPIAKTGYGDRHRMKDEDVYLCCETAPDAPYYQCSRIKGHVGLHAAHGASKRGKMFALWQKDKE